jgi:predicted dienelactone hydrolase
MRAAAILVPAGFTALRTEIPERSRPLHIDLWYPAVPNAEETIFHYQPGSIGKVALQADPAPGASPLIVLSHGVYGSARNYTWLAEGLARRGFIVAGVSHYGESPIYGTETVDPSGGRRPSERPRDCTAALDFVLAHPSFGGAADPLRVGAVGHASGGAAVLALAGAVFDPAAMREYCRSTDSHRDRGCREAAVPLEEEGGQAAGALRDERVRAVAALDPSLGPGHNARSLSQVQVPVHIVATVENDFLPFEHHAGRYARLIPGASLTPLAHGEGHFVFVDECSGEERVDGVPVCRDRDGVQRSAVHARLEEILSRFFADSLG